MQYKHKNILNIHKQIQKGNKMERWQYKKKKKSHPH